MTQEDFLKSIAEMLSQNLGNRITNELAGGIYGFINTNLQQLKQEKENGKSTDSK